MPCSLGKPNMLRAITKRGYAVQSALKSSANGQEVEVGTSTKGARLVALNKNSPLLKVSFTFKAGTRYELPDNYGITHIMRASIGIGTATFSPYFLHRSSQQRGIYLTSTSDKETFTCTVESHQSQAEEALHYLTDIAAYPTFKPWEIQDNRGRVKAEIAQRSSESIIVDLLHSAAYKTGLGNSLYCEESRVSKLNFEHCLQFFDEHFTLPRLQITSYGTDLTFLEEFITHVELPEGAGPQAAASPYVGGEARLTDYNEPAAYILVANEAPGYTKKESVAYGVLKYLYGVPPTLKYGESHGILSTALGKVGALAAVSGFSASYSDSGLVGFYLVSTPSKASEAFEAVYLAFAKADFTEKDLARAKTLYKSELLRNTEGSAILDVVSRQIAADSITLPEQLLPAIDALNINDVKQAAKKVASGRLSSVFYGNAAGVPSLELITK